jgi:hypothetical protein
MASADNNAYIDVNGNDAGKLYILVAYSNSTDVGTTAGNIWVGASASASSGSCWEATYVGRGTGWARMKFHSVFPTTDAKEALSISTAGAHLAVSVLGPFDATRFKDSNGYVKVSKAKGTSDLGRVKICPILVP